MSEETPDGQPVPDEERGRYLAVRTSPQSILIYRATGICERCRDCGCGEQQPEIDLSPGGIMKLMGRGGFKLPSPLEMMKAARNGGT